MSITFRIGKDNMQEMNLIQRYWQGINLVQKVLTGD